MLMKCFAFLFFTIFATVCVVEGTICTFTLQPDGNYSCSIDNQNILTEAAMLPIQGDHLIGYGDSDVTWLLASNSTISIFPSLIIDRFISLRLIALLDVGITSFNNPIINCQNVELLLLDFNNFSSVSGGIFRNCTNLRSLTMMWGLISSITNTGFEGLSGLQNLLLRNNQIRDLNPSAFAQLSSLTQIAISDNLIEELSPGIFGSSPLLESLDLSNNRIVSWNSSILQNNVNVRSLTLTGNLIQTVDGNAFANLQNLQALTLGSNLEEIPVLSNLGQLETLGLDSNQIRNVSAESLRNLTNLRNLYLSNNRIESVNFTMRPDKFLTTLETLTLGNNRISSIQDNAFSMLEILNELVLSSNQLERLNGNVIRPIEQLRSLDVSWNSALSEIEPELFDGVTVLDFRAFGTRCFNGNVTINNTLNNYDFLNRVVPLLDQCFNFATITKVNLMVVIFSVTLSLILKF